VKREAISGAHDLETKAMSSEGKSKQDKEEKTVVIFDFLWHL